MRSLLFVSPVLFVAPCNAGAGLEITNAHRVEGSEIVCSGALGSATLTLRWTEISG